MYDQMADLFQSLLALDTESTIVSHKQVMEKRFERYSQLLDDGKDEPKITTGLSSLDARLGGGFTSGQLIAFAGNSGEGKSTMLYQVACDTAEAGNSAGYITLEMNPDENVVRLISRRSKLGTVFQRKPSQLKHSTANDSPYQRLFNAHLDDQDLPIYYAEAISSGDIEAKIITMQQRYGIKIACVDYIQLVEGKRAGTRALEIAMITRRLKNLAQRLQIAVIIASQLNEDGKARESRDIFNDSDIFIRIEVPKGTDANSPGIRILQIQKHRQGWKGPVEVNYNPRLFTFSDKEEKPIDASLTP
jgi:replicative DNA helicase